MTKNYTKKTYFDRKPPTYTEQRMFKTSKFVFLEQTSSSHLQKTNKSNKLHNKFELYLFTSYKDYLNCISQLSYFGILPINNQN